METGNNRAMRAALEGVSEVAKRDMAHYAYAVDEGEHNAIKVWSSLLSGFCDRALAAPPRNCDRTFVDRADMYKEFRNWCNAKGHTTGPYLASEAFDWLLSRAVKDTETTEKQAKKENEYDAGHAAEWMERNPHGWYNNERDYGADSKTEST